MQCDFIKARRVFALLSMSNVLDQLTRAMKQGLNNATLGRNVPNHNHFSTPLDRWGLFFHDPSCLHTHTHTHTVSLHLSLSLSLAASTVAENK